MGFLYLIKNLDVPNRYKIGISKNVDSRLSALEATTGSKLEIINFLDCGEDSKRVERWLHNEYKGYLHNGEWFNFDELTLKQVINIFNSKNLSVLDDNLKGFFLLKASCIKERYLMGYCTENIFEHKISIEKSSGIDLQVLSVLNTPYRKIWTDIKHSFYFRSFLSYAKHSMYYGNNYGWLTIPYDKVYMVNNFLSDSKTKKHIIYLNSPLLEEIICS